MAMQGGADTRTLAIECATDACSIALFADDRLIGAEHRVLGRGHAEHLVPMIAALPDRGRASRILVSLGPGSFTGLRIGVATARALGFAWGAAVQGYPTLALVAAVARSEADGPVTVCMTGGHSEWFVQNFAADGLPEDDVVSLSPAAAATITVHPMVAGSQARSLAAGAHASARPLDVLPDARFVTQLPRALITSALAPLYGRAPDARVPA